MKTKIYIFLYTKINRSKMNIKNTNKTELSQETILAIENARERIKQGNYITEEEALRRLGM